MARGAEILRPWSQQPFHPMITIQYLEDAPDLPDREADIVARKLRAAAETLPISRLLIGWRLPTPLLEACRGEAERLGLRFLRWHPLLTGDAIFQPRPEWQVVGATNRRVPGYRGMPEFTFVCPNHPEVQAAISRRLEDLLREGIYDGFFLDRIRFPSPASHPLDDLGCFCEHCRRQAAAAGLDLEQVRERVEALTGTPQGSMSLVQILLGGDAPAVPRAEAEVMQAFLDFRAESVARFVEMLAQPLRQAGMEIGLDCFSPGLTTMVGQDLGALGAHSDWIKVMSYAHTRGPAGIPFELLGLFDYLSAAGLEQPWVLSKIGEAIQLPLPESRTALERDGISSAALEAELRRGAAATSTPVLAGFELVQIEGVAELNDAQIQADLAAVRCSGVAGLSISWDLWDIPLERLELVRRTYLS